MPNQSGLVVAEHGVLEEPDAGGVAARQVEEPEVIVGEEPVFAAEGFGLPLRLRELGAAHVEDGADGSRKAQPVRHFEEPVAGVEEYVLGEWSSRRVRSGARRRGF